MKRGTVRIYREFDDMGMYGGDCDVEILVNNIGGHNYTLAWLIRDTYFLVGEPPYVSQVYRNANPATDDGAKALFKKFAPAGVKSYEWLEPLTEVPSQGGGSGITIDDVYPVGIEITTTDTTFNPMKVWGGTWTVSPVGAKRASSPTSGSSLLPKFPLRVAVLVSPSMTSIRSASRSPRLIRLSTP